MPTGVSAYLAFYVAFCTWAHHDDFRSKGSFNFFGITEIAGNICLLIAACSYWLPSLRVLGSSFLSVLFLVGLAIFLAQGVVVGRKQIRGEPHSMLGKFLVLIPGLLLSAVVFGPALYWAWQATVGGAYAET